MDTDEILLIAMESIFNLVHPEVAVLGLWEGDGKFSIRYRATDGGPEKINLQYSPTSGDPETITSNVEFPIPHENIHHVFPLLLKRNNKVIGGLWVGQAYNPPLTSSDKMVCESLAQQISIAIEHALITAQLQSNAVVEERARLAREMHDGLSQILGFHFVNLENGTIRSFLVSHGRGSDPGHSGFLQQFSGIPGSEATSRGAYLTAEWYNGKYGTSIRLLGLDADNRTALERAIVMHPAKYAAASHIEKFGKLGRSEG